MTAAIRPTDNIVVAPADGTVVKIFNTNHAFCPETDKGAEIVVHMGIDTVALEGRGFKRPVEEGAEVKAGQPILELDLDYLNANARSMISPVVVSNSDDYAGGGAGQRLCRRRSDQAVRDPKVRPFYLSSTGAGHASWRSLPRLGGKRAISSRFLVHRALA